MQENKDHSNTKPHSLFQRKKKGQWNLSLSPGNSWPWETFPLADQVSRPHPYTFPVLASSTSIHQSHSLPLSFSGWGGNHKKEKQQFMWKEQSWKSPSSPTEMSSYKALYGNDSRGWTLFSEAKSSCIEPNLQSLWCMLPEMQILEFFSCSQYKPESKMSPVCYNWFQWRGFTQPSLCVHAVKVQETTHFQSLWSPRSKKQKPKIRSTIFLQGLTW